MLGSVNYRPVIMPLLNRLQGPGCEFLFADQAFGDKIREKDEQRARSITRIPNEEPILALLDLAGKSIFGKPSGSFSSFTPSRIFNPSPGLSGFTGSGEPIAYQEIVDGPPDLPGDVLFVGGVRFPVQRRDLFSMFRIFRKNLQKRQEDTAKGLIGVGVAIPPHGGCQCSVCQKSLEIKSPGTYRCSSCKVSLLVPASSICPECKSQETYLSGHRLKSAIGGIVGGVVGTVVLGPVGGFIGVAAGGRGHGVYHCDKCEAQWALRLPIAEDVRQ